MKYSKVKPKKQASKQKSQQIRVGQTTEIEGER